MCSAGIRDVQRALLANGALQYAPSLSARVLDALFSFWRLPFAARREISSALPAIALDALPASACVDWGRLASCIRASTGAGAAANPMETAWALALQAEAAVTKSLLTKRSHITCDLRVTHGEQLGTLLGLLHDDSGEFYMAFVVLITVLEKALYDLYHHHHHHHQHHEQSSSKGRKKNMILRDLLHSETIARVLPDGLLLLLRILFLPSGLNLRNLVWHGFMVPAEFPKCFGCLVVVLLLALPRVTAAPVTLTDSEHLFDVRSYDDRFIVRDDALRHELSALFRHPSASGHLKDLIEATTSSRFIPLGRRELVRKAFRALVERGDELWFLFALLPVLEHAVRVAFIETNRERWGLSSEYGVAQIDAYYSTLDGFGQRDKHQVLLHSHVAMEESGDDEESRPTSQLRRLNQLYTALPSAALAVCLDLFMMAAGPNLRAKLCHGEADLSTLLRTPSAAATSPCSRLSVATQLVVLTWLSICCSTDSESFSTTAVETFEKSYTSSFHPFYQLERALASALAAAQQFASVRERYARLQLSPIHSGSEPMVWVEFPSVGDTTDSETVAAGRRSAFGVLEKASRIGDFCELLLEQGDGLFVCESTSPLVDSQRKTPTKGSFPELLVRLRGNLREALRKLRRHYEDQHDGRRQSAFLGLLDHPAATERSAQLLVNAPGLESYLLALGDDDGLSVAACMLEAVASAQRAYSSFQARHLDLQQLIAAGRARTNHRRSFLNSVFFLPIFEIVQALCLSLIEHQLLHLHSLAVSGSLEAQQSCPRARSFEVLQRKLLLFVTAFEGCAGGSSDASAQKSAEKALLLALQFFDSKAMKAALSS